MKSINYSLSETELIFAVNTTQRFWISGLHSLFEYSFEMKKKKKKDFMQFLLFSLSQCGEKNPVSLKEADENLVFQIAREVEKYLETWNTFMCLVCLKKLY